MPNVLTEIVLGCVDLVLSEAWYREGLGLAPAGGRRLTAGTPFAADVLDGEGRQAVCWWMVGDNPAFRIALVQFSLPLPTLLPYDHCALDLGAVRIGVHVADFDRTLERMVALESPPLAPVAGAAGSRRVCVRSPDGIYVELLERDPLPDAPRAPNGTGAVVRSLSVTTADLDGALAFHAIRLGAADGPVLHDDADEALWGLAGASARRAVFRAGDVLLELVQYTNRPMRPLAARRLPSDQGVASLGFSGPGESGFVAGPDGLWLSNTARRGYRPGFAPRSPWRRPRVYDYLIDESHFIAAPPERVWRALNDHNRMGEWIECDIFTLTRHGEPDSAGYGAERLLDAMGRQVLQQVNYRGQTLFGYRALAGTPFSYHNGTGQVFRDGAGTRVNWKIRYRTVSRPVGAGIQTVLGKGIGEMLVRLGAMVEAEQVLDRP